VEVIGNREAEKPATTPVVKRPGSSVQVNDLPKLAKQARGFLQSPDAPDAHRIQSISGPASELRVAGRDYLMQPVRFADGTQRNAYFAITENGLQFDTASFTGESDLRWSAETNSGGSIAVKQSVGSPGKCRLYVRPADYFNFAFSSSRDFVCFKLDDANMKVSAFGYARRDSAVARDLERLFGKEAMSSSEGLATQRRWTAHSLTLELSMPEGQAPNQFLIESVLSDSWLLPSDSEQQQANSILLSQQTR
jgi:hypothetical protein